MGAFKEVEEWQALNACEDDRTGMPCACAFRIAFASAVSAPRSREIPFALSAQEPDIWCLVMIEQRRRFCGTPEADRSQTISTSFFARAHEMPAGANPRAAS
jgi:hypothetical protein